MTGPCMSVVASFGCSVVSAVGIGRSGSLGWLDRSVRSFGGGRIWRCRRKIGDEVLGEAAWRTKGGSE